MVQISKKKPHNNASEVKRAAAHEYYFWSNAACFISGGKKKGLFIQWKNLTSLFRKYADVTIDVSSKAGWINQPHVLWVLKIIYESKESILEMMEGIKTGPSHISHVTAVNTGVINNINHGPVPFRWARPPVVCVCRLIGRAVSLNRTSLWLINYTCVYPAMTC